MVSAILSLINVDFVDLNDFFRYLIPRSGVTFLCRNDLNPHQGNIWSVDPEVELDLSKRVFEVFMNRYS